MTTRRGEADEAEGGSPDAADATPRPGGVRVAHRNPTPLHAALSRTLLRTETWVRSHRSARIRLRGASGLLAPITPFLTRRARTR